ncbi:hypothetical protein GCM10011507_20650 [Edaphobacter acidisoli]|uniref:DUF4440 domain-containing protein n=1 Tax=Edaphobacter acidisoli TaxID=2040573 RepID=A0A916RTR5_9BACT|nr:hypothetical protein GCM10011507_20650 [Edaphobacter acidisoli]
MAATVLLATVGQAARPAFANQGLHERKHDAKKQVEALEEQWRTARLAGDIATMDKMLSDDYIGISMTGQVSTKAQQLSRVRDHRVVLTRIDLGDMQIKLVGAIAIVTSRADVTGTNDGVTIQGTYRYTRVYQRQPNGVWKITSFEATRVPSRDMHHHREDASSAPPSASQP